MMLDFTLPWWRRLMRRMGLSVRASRAIGLCYGVSAACIAAAAWRAGAGWPGLLGVALFAGHLGGQVLRLDTRNGRGALRLFRSNRDAGLILFLGLAADAVLRHLTGP
jgi:4-hydroxybenzoate polyprenyltransferase